MLNIKNIKKSYKTGDFIQHALKGVSINFRKNEFVAILGQSGSGKTTLLNIIGGLDRYDSGDLLINNTSTKMYKDKSWDAYRNNCVGFIFQSYNLITHISVLSNVEMALTLSNVSKSARKKKALAALEEVGLKEHAHKRPNQLSGGQMQRVAIARALVNDPEIILADEPTGALDTKTSIQIMELIKKIAEKKLVIMVTHNPEIAKEYANRIIELKDGEIVSDSNEYKEEKDNSKLIVKKTKMSLLSALGLSFNNILTKKGRTFLTALASSIGIIGIALILALSNGFDIQIDNFEKNSLSSMPIMIQKEATEFEETGMPTGVAELQDLEEYPDENIIYTQYDFTESTHLNNMNDEFINLVENIDDEYVSGVTYNKGVGLNIIYNYNSEYLYTTSNALGMSSIPENNILEENFDVLSGKLPSNKNEVVLVLDMTNSVSKNTLNLLGLNDEEEINFEDVMGKEFKIYLNDDFYNNAAGYYFPNTNYEELYNSEKAITITVSGIVRNKEDVMTFIQQGIVYQESLNDYIIENNKNSAIVNAQLNADYNVMTGEKFSGEDGQSAKDMMISYLGGSEEPLMIQIYPKDFESKEKILEIIEDYNESTTEENEIVYVDLAEMITSLSGNIMDAITIVLIAFSAISLIVSSIMIGIITYISVLERTKEIGVLRSLGARKKDITRVFNAETSIIGIFSGLLGIGIAWLLLIPANAIILNLTDLENVAVLNPLHALLLITVSFVLTVLGGFIPAKMASKKDPVNALRSE